jgi:C-terminal processing protease CtpA/Prc
VVIRRSACLAALFLGACAGFDPLTSADSERVAAFDFYWEQLADNYPFFGKDLLDWKEVRRQYRAAVPFAQRPHEFFHLLSGMFSELNDPHISYTPPEDGWVEDGVQPTSLLDRPGFDLMVVEGRVYVVGWPGGEAPEPPEDLPHHARFPQLWRVNGSKIVSSLLGNLMIGPPGSPVELQLRWNDEVVTRHVVARPEAGVVARGSWLAHLARPQQQLAEYDGDRDYGVLRLHTMNQVLLGEALGAVDAWIDQAMEKDGLVLDLRRNYGGNLEVGRQIVGRFLPEATDLVFVTAQEQVTTIWPFSVELFLLVQFAPRGKRYDKPLVILTSSMTASMAEHAARILQRDCGAIVIGERTAGAEAGIERVYGPEGGVLEYSETRLVDRTGVGFQDEGVVPDVSVRLRIEDVAAFGPERSARDWEQRLFDAAERAIRSARRR